VSHPGPARLRKMKNTDRITVPRIRCRKKKGEKSVMITAYDYTMARLVDQAGVDMILVGDSLGMVIQGHSNTLPVTLEHMIYHCACVSQGAKRALVIGDMPFMTYQASVEQALVSCGRVLKEGSAHAVKLEGGREITETIKRLVSSGIPVVGHVGLTPQSVHSIGGFRVQGKKRADQERIIDDALAVAEAGAFCIVLESIPGDLAQRITDEVAVPTIGIGAGVHCDGQVLVCYDMLGFYDDFRPKFLKVYEEFGRKGTEAVKTYIDEVHNGVFPAEEHTVKSKTTGRGGLRALYGGARTSG